MIKIYFTKLVNIYLFLICKIIDFAISFQLPDTYNGTILLIRIDPIDDNILVRKFIQYIK